MLIFFQFFFFIHSKAADLIFQFIFIYHLCSLLICKIDFKYTAFKNEKKKNNEGSFFVGLQKIEGTFTPGVNDS